MLLLLALLWSPVQNCGDHEAWVSHLSAQYLARKMMDRSFEGDMVQAHKVRACFVKQLTAKMGEQVGYKAALTSPVAQRRFGVNEPLLGVLTENMLKPSPHQTALTFGSRSMIEGDLLVRVADEAINEAKTEEEALAALDAAFPFLELADMVYAPDIPLSGPAITAVNAGARAGVTGPEIPLNSLIWRDGLAAMNLVMLDSGGQVLAKGKTAALLGHPLKAVLWIRDAVNAQGVRLKKGDLLSLGSATPPVIIKEPGTVILRYSGGPLKDVLEVKVRFTGGDD